MYIHTYIHTYTYMYIQRCLYVYMLRGYVCDVFMCAHVYSFFVFIYIHTYTKYPCICYPYGTRGQMCHSGAFYPKYFLIEFFSPQIWDPRTDVPQRSIFGAHITGDSMDQWGNFVVTGSWRPEKQLQVVSKFEKLIIRWAINCISNGLID